MNSNIPKTTCLIVATISLIAICFSILSPFWFWVSFELSALSLVSIGCCGEWYLHHHPSGRKKLEKEAHHKQESRFIGAVVVGVIMELFSLGHTIGEGIKLEGRIEELRRETAKLWLKINPRAFLDWNVSAQSLSRFAGTKFSILEKANGDEPDADRTAIRLRKVLRAAGWSEIQAGGAVVSIGQNKEFPPNRTNEFNPIVEGIWVGTGIRPGDTSPDVVMAPKAVNALIDELNRNRILAKVIGPPLERVELLLPGVVQIQIGRRPLPDADPATLFR